MLTTLYLICFLFVSFRFARFWNSSKWFMNTLKYAIEERKKIGRIFFLSMHTRKVDARGLYSVHTNSHYTYMLFWVVVVSFLLLLLHTKIWKKIYLISSAFLRFTYFFFVFNCTLFRLGWCFLWCVVLLCLM